MIQLIVTDMDGTLLDEEKRLPSKLPRLLEELYRRDITFAVASGRSHMMLTNLFGELAEEMIFICDNGACVMYPHEAAQIHALPDEVVWRVVEASEPLHGTVPVLCGFQKIYYLKNRLTPSAAEELERYYGNALGISEDAAQCLEEPILKVALCNMESITRETYPAMQSLLGDTYELLVSGNCWMDIMCKGVTKGAAVAQLQERMGISPAETMAFGDYDNDISMLQCAEHSYAMENAPEHVKRIAAHIAPPNTQDGVVRVLCETLGIEC